MKKISVIIPTYNGQKLLKKHLTSVLKALRHQDELIIIDDASTDESVEWLLSYFKLEWQEKHTLHLLYYLSNKKNNSKEISIKILQNKSNQRYAVSVNRAVKLASNDLIFLLNSDVSLNPDTLDKLVKFYEKENANDDVFGVGCLEYEGDSEKAKKAGKNKLWFEKGMFMHSKADNFKSGETGWISGGSGLFDRNKWQQLNGFDTYFYPAYWEDVDLSFRAKKQGWQVLFCSEAVVFHQHESTNASVFKKSEIAQMSWAHSIYFTEKHMNLLQKISFKLFKPYWKWKKWRTKN